MPGRRGQGAQPGVLGGVEITLLRQGDEAAQYALEEQDSAEAEQSSQQGEAPGLVGHRVRTRVCPAGFAGRSRPSLPRTKYRQYSHR